MRLTTVVVEALDVQAKANFWAQALGWRSPEDDPHSVTVGETERRGEELGVLRPRRITVHERTRAVVLEAGASHR
jgi:hypothetical protein